jgi:Resolvase, N terminal domain
MTDPSKIKPTHTQRAACVYIRQSTPGQVEHNREFAARQYALADKACQLGWPKEQVILIDEDLGLSGSTTDKRSGFARLTSEVALAHVGIVLGLEVSRLARNNADWYRLLELCGVTDTLIGDNDGVYHPALFNDRLILGLNRPETQSTSYSAFCWAISLGSVVSFRTGALLASLQTIPPADIADMLTGETPAKGAAQAGTIERCGDFCIRAPRRHSVNPGNGFFWRFQRALSRCSPLYGKTRYRARTPTNLHLDLPRLAAPIHLHGFDRHAQ